MSLMVLSAQSFMLCALYFYLSLSIFLIFLTSNLDGGLIVISAEKSLVTEPPKDFSSTSSSSES